MGSELPTVTIYTDGGCRPNPGPGGWGAVLLFPGREPVELSGGKPEATNNRMEMVAAIEALGALEAPHRVEIFTDSTYLRTGITEWLPATVPGTEFGTEFRIYGEPLRKGEPSSPREVDS